MLTKEFLLKDPNIKKNWGDSSHESYLNSDFEFGVDYGEAITIERTLKWLSLNIVSGIYWSAEGSIEKNNLIKRLREFLESDEMI